MSPPLGEEISARNAPGIPLPVLFGVLALMLIVPSLYNVVRSAFRWEPALAPTMVVDGRTLFVVQADGCDDRSSCAAGLRFANTNYVDEFATTGPLGPPLAALPDGTVAATTVPGFEGSHDWVAINLPGKGWALARPSRNDGKAFSADLVCRAVIVTQQAQCRAAAAGR